VWWLKLGTVWNSVQIKETEVDNKKKKKKKKNSDVDLWKV